jgi:hypothetical protein
MARNRQGIQSVTRLCITSRELLPVCPSLGTIGRVVEMPSPFNSASIPGKLISQQLTDTGKSKEFCLPRLQNDEAIGVADVDAPEEHGWQQAVYLYLGNILPCGRGSYEKYLMKGKSADFHLLRRHDGKHSFNSIWTVIAYWRICGESTCNVFANVVQKRVAYTGIEE